MVDGSYLFIVFLQWKKHSFTLVDGKRIGEEPENNVYWHLKIMMQQNCMYHFIHISILPLSLFFLFLQEKRQGANREREFHPKINLWTILTKVGWDKKIVDQHISGKSSDNNILPKNFVVLSDYLIIGAFSGIGLVEKGNGYITVFFIQIFGPTSYLNMIMPSKNVFFLLYFHKMVAQSKKSL